MSADYTYLDYNATAPLHPLVVKAIQEELNLTGNPSSKHRMGQNARFRVEQARKSVLSFLHAENHQLIFTSGATESNALVFKQPWEHVFSTSTEHPSISSNVNYHAIPYQHAWRLDLDWLEDRLRPLAQTTAKSAILISVQMANSECGLMHSLQEIFTLAKKYGAYTHTDATQAFARVPIHINDLGVDLLTLSAHKAGGPKGIGALVFKENMHLKPLSQGSQEFGFRAGTENNLGIIGFGALCPHVSWAHNKQLQKWHQNLEDELLQINPASAPLRGFTNRLPNTSVLVMPNNTATSQIIQFDLQGFAVAAGSACHSQTSSPMQSLLALGFSQEIASSAIRISSGWGSTEDHFARLAHTWKNIEKK